MRLNLSRDPLLLVFLVIFTVTPAVAVEVSFSGKLDKNGVPAGWKLKEKTGDAELKVYSEEGENEDPKSIKGIRIQINTQHTGTVAERVFGRIQFSRD